MCWGGREKSRDPTRRSVMPRSVPSAVDRLRLDPDLDFIARDEGLIEMTEAGVRRMVQALIARYCVSSPQSAGLMSQPPQEGRHPAGVALGCRGGERHSAAPIRISRGRRRPKKRPRPPQSRKLRFAPSTRFVSRRDQLASKRFRPLDPKAERQQKSCS